MLFHHHLASDVQHGIHVMDPHIGNAIHKDFHICKEAPKVLPWVHVAIANAKKLIDDMYHGVKGKFLQQYLNEFCYKFNRKYFGDRLFERLMICSVSYKPTFEHQLYGSKPKAAYTDRCG